MFIIFMEPYLANRYYTYRVPVMIELTIVAPEAVFTVPQRMG